MTESWYERYVYQEIDKGFAVLDTANGNFVHEVYPTAYEAARMCIKLNAEGKTK